MGKLNISGKSKLSTKVEGFARCLCCSVHLFKIRNCEYSKMWLVITGFETHLGNLSETLFWLCTNSRHFGFNITHLLCVHLPEYLSPVFALDEFISPRCRFCSTLSTLGTYFTIRIVAKCFAVSQINWNVYFTPEDFPSEKWQNVYKRKTSLQV